MKTVFISKKSSMVLASLDNIDINHSLYDSYYETEVDDDFHVHVSGDAVVYDCAVVSEKAVLYGKATAAGNARIYGSAVVSGQAEISGNATVFEKAMITGNAIVAWNAKVYGRARVYENAMISGDATVSENAQVYGNAIVDKGAKATGRIINVIGLPYDITITDNHIAIGCKQFSFKTARKLAKRNINIEKEYYNTMIIYKDLLLSLIKHHKELKK